ncbi:MAG: hypothetical protein ACO1N2_03480 [Candidatus Saccharimonadota bacterium]
MVPFIDSLFLFIAALIAVAVLGIIAGFSPTLYIAQVSIGSKPKRIIPYTIGLMAGVLGAVIFLMLLFQVFQLDTLVSIIDSTVSALLLSVGFNIVVGTGLIVGGLWYIRSRKESPKPLKETRAAAAARSKAGIGAIVSLGFIRTLTSISGLTATFIASGLISSGNPLLLERSLMTLVFLAASIVPFAGIIVLLKRSPERLTKLTGRLKELMHRINYRLIAGVAAVILGSSIIIFNLMMALFY